MSQCRTPEEDSGIRFVARRLLLAVPTLVGVATVVFFLARLTPGDPARAIAGETATAEQIERIRENLGLNLPLYEQYVRFMLNWPAETSEIPQ